MNLKIIDNGGEWFLNQGVFSFIDPETNIRYDPGVHVKTARTDWLTLQSACIVKVADPTQAEPEAPVEPVKQEPKTDKPEAPSLAEALAKK